MTIIITPTHPTHDNVPYGNTTTLIFDFKTDANGVVQNTRTPSAKVKKDDLIVLGTIPAGTRIIDVQVINNEVKATSTTKLTLAIDKNDHQIDRVIFLDKEMIKAGERLQLKENTFFYCPYQNSLLLKASSDINDSCDLTFVVSGMQLGAKYPKK